MDDKWTKRRGDLTSKGEREEFSKYLSRMTISQRAQILHILGRLTVRNSFKHGRFRKALTLMAIYACGCELVHDFHIFEHGGDIDSFISMFGAKHAVGLLAISHLSEHVKEILEDAEKPKYLLEDHMRHELEAILGEDEECEAWPHYLKVHHRRWKRSRNDLETFKLKQEGAGGLSRGSGSDSSSSGNADRSGSSSDSSGGIGGGSSSPAVVDTSQSKQAAKRQQNKHDGDV